MTIDDSFPAGQLRHTARERIVSEESQGNDIWQEVGKRIASVGLRMALARGKVEDGLGGRKQQ